MGFFHDYLHMNFWERVCEIMEKQDINKKTLATEAGFDPSNITKGVKNNNCPSAETAVKIAKKLGVSVEYLITGNREEAKTSRDMFLYKKYQSIIELLESMPAQKQKTAIQIIEQCKELCS